LLQRGSLGRHSQKANSYLSRDNMLVIATNGRGMWVIDDVSALQK
jgi:hypothetical protein